MTAKRAAVAAVAIFGFASGARAQAPAGSEFQVNTYTTGSQFPFSGQGTVHSVALRDDGSFVIAWSGPGPGDGYGAFARRYDTAGAPLGSEFVVNASTFGNQGGASVARGSGGTFVVAFNDSGGYVKSRLVASDGTASAQQTLSPTSSDPSWPAAWPSVSGNTSGNFVVSWVGTGGVFGRRLDSSGVPVGAQFQVNTTTGGYQLYGASAIAADGSFMVVWSHDLSQIRARRFNSSGTAIGADFKVNTYTDGGKRWPAVALDNSGNAFVAWTDDTADGNGSSGGIFGQRYDSSGAPLGGEFQINANSLGSQWRPSVSADGSGNFIVAWEDSILESPSTLGIAVRKYDSSGNSVGAQFRANTYTTGTQRAAAVSVNSAGDFVVTWASNGQDGNSYGVFGRKFLLDTDGDGVADANDNCPLVANPGQENADSDALGDACDDDLDGDGVDNASDNCAFVANPGQENQDGDGLGDACDGCPADSGKVNPGVCGCGVPDSDIDFDGTPDCVDQCPFDSPKIAPGVCGCSTPDTDSDSDGTPDCNDQCPSDPNKVVPGTCGCGVAETDACDPGPGPEISVHPDFPFWFFNQTQPAIASDAGGNFVVAWTDERLNYYGYGYPDQQPSGIFAQRFNKNGNRLGGVLSTTTGSFSQVSPAVASGATGNFVVVWQSQYQDGDSNGIFGQRYDRNGNRLGGEFQVNSYATGSQYDPAVASDANGNFVVAWRSPNQDGDQGGIFAQRFSSAGARKGAEFQVNAQSSGHQWYPAVSSDPTGAFVIVWMSQGQDGDDAGVFGRRYDKTGAPAGAEFQVNTYTPDWQWLPSVASDASGNFVVAWQSQYQDGDGGGIFAQRFDSTGTRLGAEFQANTYTTGWQAAPSIARDASGKFVIAWHSYQDGSGNGVFAQRYNKDGVAVGGEFLVNSYTPFDQRFPVLGAGAGGNFVAAWQSQYQDGYGAGIFGQRLCAGNPALPTLSLSDVTMPEGSSGTSLATFVVTLSNASASTVTVKYKTLDGTATSADGDYTAKALTTLTFTPGQTTKNINVTVAGDMKNENDESFYVDLSSPTNASICGGRGIGTIQNDDPEPTISVADASVTEGNAGSKTMTFTVTLSKVSSKTVTVAYATAKAGTGLGFARVNPPADYQAKSGTLTFTAGVKTMTVPVTILGDTLVEGDETFYFNLSGPTKASILDGQATGTIIDND